MSPQTEPQVSAKSEPQYWGQEALLKSREVRRQLQDRIADRRDRWIRSNAYLYGRVKRALQFVVEPGRKVLEIRSLTGDFLDAVNPAEGVGVEIGDKLVSISRTKYPRLRFVTAEPEDLDLGEKFDYVIFNHVFDTVDIIRALEKAREHCHDRGRLLVLNYNQLWQPLLEWLSKIRLRAPFAEPNWVTEQDLRGLLELADFRVIRTQRFLLFPKRIPLISWFLNDVLAGLPGIRRLCMMELLVARPKPSPVREEDLSVSVIIPCKNERGNVQSAVERIPSLGYSTEIIFGDDKSTDGTAEEVRRMQRLYPEKNVRLVDGPGICKAENVWRCFDAAKGDILMILDADLTVMPEELRYFLRAIASGQGEFTNGSRLVYPVPRAAMKFTNRIGNKLFGVIFSFLLQQRLKDTLCGTKVLWREDWHRMLPNLGAWGLKDMWGDYELLFGAAKLNLEIVEVPVHYQERVYGVTKMTRVLGNGIRMLGICWCAWRKLN